VVSFVKPFKDATAALNIAQVTKASDMYVALINEQVSILTLMSQFKKPTFSKKDLGFLGTLQAETFKQIDEVKRKDFKAPPNHLQTLIDGIAIMSWYNFEAGDSVRDTMKEF